MLSKYDNWKLSEPEEKEITECCQCSKQLFSGQEAIYDQEGGVHFCDEKCLTEFVRQHPGEFLEVIMDHFFEKVDL